MYPFAVFCLDKFLCFFASYESAFTYCLNFPSRYMSIFRLIEDIEPDGHDLD